MYKVESLFLTEEEKKKAPDGAFIDLPVGFTHYKIEGNDGEWVVLTHGFATPYYIYDKIAEGLVAAGYRVLRYDLIGRGLSERLRKRYTPALFVRQLHELTQALLGDQSFYLFGTSMGGTITTSFVAAYPDKVKKLVLLAPAGMHYKAPAYMYLVSVPGIGSLVFNIVARKALVKKCASEMLKSGEDVKRHYEEQFAYAFQYKGVLYATRSSMAHTILNFKDAHKGYIGTAKSGIPVLVIWGTEDKTMPYYQIDEMKTILQNAEFITYEGSGHIFLYDEGERTAKDAIAFLSKK